MYTLIGSLYVTHRWYLPWFISVVGISAWTFSALITMLVIHLLLLLGCGTFPTPVRWKWWCTYVGRIILEYWFMFMSTFVNSLHYCIGTIFHSCRMNRVLLILKSTVILLIVGLRLMGSLCLDMETWWLHFCKRM